MDDNRPYLGLEHIEPGTGRLAEGTFGPTEPEEFSVTSGESLCNTFEPGDVLFGKLRPYLTKAWIAEFSGRCTTEFLVMQPVNFNSRFLQYICLSPGFIDAVNASTYGSKMPRADWNFIGNMPVPLPALDKQNIIADYLDKEILKLDDMLDAKKRLLDLLEEKRRSLITRAVTRGLNSSAQMRDSGVEWLGPIPKYWKTKRVKYLFRLITEPAPPDNNFELLSLYTEVGVLPRKDIEARGNKATTTDNYWLVKPGDLVVNKLLAWMGAFGVSNYEGVTSPAYDILRKLNGVNSIYYHHLFRCGICFPEFRRRSTGIMDMRLRLYFDQFGDMRVPVPPENDQYAIVRYIQQETAKLDSLRNAAEKTIGLLNERRSALISAAVTGKLEVN
ncbi:MAG: restriction endonuclease subunit S [Syntrophales bacterium]|nr:restriction endonuclease subunit S [Syntrophales bacterium]